MSDNNGSPCLKFLVKIEDKNSSQKFQLALPLRMPVANLEIYIITIIIFIK